jgi:hypothetical protein
MLVVLLRFFLSVAVLAAVQGQQLVAEVAGEAVKFSIMFF